jgi:hypothetical protein
VQKPFEGFFHFRRTGSDKALVVDNSCSVNGAGMNYDLTAGRAKLETHIVGVVGIKGVILSGKTICV